MTQTKIIASARALNPGEALTTSIAAGGHTLVADEPIGYGGADQGAAPGEYVCAALAACKAITLRLYARRKGWDLGEITVSVKMVRGEQAPSGQNTFYCEVQVGGALSDEQQRRLLHIARACPVSRLLGKASDVVTLIA